MPSLTKVQPAFILAQGAIELDSGTASAPSLKFATSSATGMFSPSTGALAFSTGSTQNALTILADGNIGVGLTNPSRKLDIQIQTASLAVGSVLSSHPIAEFINLSGGATRGLEIGSPADSVTSPVYLKVAGTGNRFAILNQSDSEQLTILNNGNVGIGTTNPTSKLDVAGTVTATNFADATGGYNVNLGSGGAVFIEGRGLVAGYSGGSYGGIGYNVRHTTTGGTYIAPVADTSNYLLFNQGFTFLGENGGSAGRTLSYNSLARLDSSGNFLQTRSGSYHRIAYSNFDNNYSSTQWWNGLALGNNGDNYIVAGRTNVGGQLKFYVNNTNDITSNTTPGGTLALTLASNGNATFGGTVSASQVIGGNGSAIGSAGLVVNGTVGDNDSQLILKKPSQSSFGVLAWDGQVFLSSNIYYENGAWTHNGPSGNNNNQLFVLEPGSGVRWYASNNGIGSFNVAGGTILWTSAGNWDRPLTTNVTYNGNTIWHAGNDGAGSGLDADLLDGLSSGSFIQTPGSTSQMISGNINGAVNPDNVTINGIQYCTSVSLLGQTDGALYSQAYSSSWIGQIFQDYRTGQLALRGKNSGTWQPWRTNWDSGNDGAGSGLDADLLDGLDLHTGRNNEANKVVRTDGSGYIQAGWINTISGDLGVSNRLDRVYTSNDGYIRYLGLTDFKNQMGLSSKNNYSRRVDYTSDANYWVGSFGHSGYGANETFHGGSGFFDIWSGTNYPGGFTHIHGINMLHYTTNSLGSTGGVAYGWQLTTQYDSDAGPYWRRCSAGSFSNWRKIWHDTNDGAGSGLDADLLDGNNSSYFLDTSSTTQTKTGRLNIHGDFLVAVNGTTANHIVQRPYTINNGTLSWEGSAGQLFSITNNLTTGSIFSVNDVSGIPSIDVDADGTIKLAPFNGTVAIKQITETSVNNFNTTLSPSSGTLTIDVSVGTVILGDLNASVTTWAFTNVPTTNNRATTITLIIDGDTSQTYGEACSVNGSAITGGVKWAGGSAPPSTDAFDIISFTIVKDGAGTINVFGSGNTNLFT